MPLALFSASLDGPWRAILARPSDSGCEQSGGARPATLPARMQPAVFAPCAFPDHALLDSGAGEKLERYGSVVLARPAPQALWRKRLDARAWKRADLVFVRESDRGGRWEAREGRRVSESWGLAFERARFRVKPTPFKHVGVF